MTHSDEGPDWHAVEVDQMRDTERDDLRQEVARLEAENDALKARVADLEYALEESAQEARKVSAMEDALRAENARLKALLHEAILYAVDESGVVTYGKVRAELDARVAQKKTAP